MKPLISVVVCAYNDESTIARVLDAVSRLTYNPLEVLVINDASTDRTAQIAKNFNVAVIENPSNMGLGYNQNLGLSLAKGEYMALIQSDCEILQDDWLEQMAELMTYDVAVVVSQREISNFPELPAGARLFNAVAPQDLVNKTGKPLEQNYCRGKADLYRVSVLRELNGWNGEFFTAGEDTDLSIRLRKLGHRILLHPSAKVRYLFSNRQATVAGSLRKGFLYGSVAYPLYRLHQYDGIQSRTYAHILLAGIALILPFPWNGLLGILVLGNSFTSKIHSQWKSTSLGVLSLIACVPLVMLNSAHDLRGIAQAIPGGILLAGATYTGYLAAKNTFRNYRKGEKIHRLPGTFLFSVVWRLASGAGYLAGATKGYKKRKTQQKQHADPAN
ncbi:MAG TPA: glycosyltransferase family 2 protein [Acidobacteriota bacterium]|nr:glycosyltransferase family 2 protein [Acidobacteriota bacterium]